MTGNAQTHEDQDSDVSFENDTEEELDTTVIEKEDWVDNIKRSTNDDMEKMGNEKIQCWNKTNKKMKWRPAPREAASPICEMVDERCRMEPELSSTYRTNSDW